MASEHKVPDYSTELTACISKIHFVESTVENIADGLRQPQEYLPGMALVLEEVREQMENMMDGLYNQEA